MTVIHLIRHGETDGNQSHYIGRRDLALNAKGHAQAEQLALGLSGFPIGWVISSPLQRAVQTARPLAQQFGLSIEVEPALIEFDFGVLQDLPKAEQALSLRKHHARTPVEGGESLEGVWNRLSPFVASLQSRFLRADVAIVGHYWSNRMLYGLLSGASFEQALCHNDYKPVNGEWVSLVARPKSRHTSRRS
jgi:broad specificity phosphatase PhoE